MKGGRGIGGTHKDTAVCGNIRKAVVDSANAAIIQTTWCVTIVYLVIWKINRIGVIYAGEARRFA